MILWRQVSIGHLKGYPEGLDKEVEEEKKRMISLL